MRKFEQDATSWHYLAACRGVMSDIFARVGGPDIDRSIGTRACRERVRSIGLEAGMLVPVNKTTDT